MERYELDLSFDDCVEVELANPDDFLKVRETLTRMGIANYKTKTLYQTCHILHKRGRYAILHFKELFALDKKKVDITQEDIARRNTICNLLEYWGLVKILDPLKTQSLVLENLKGLSVIKHSEKKNWTIHQKYLIGNKSHSKKDEHDGKDSEESVSE